MRNVGTCLVMVRERSEAVERRKDLSTDARGRGGTARSSEEALVMRVERRGSPVRVEARVNQQWEEHMTETLGDEQEEPYEARASRTVL